MKDRQNPAKKIVMAAATGAALGGGFAVGWRLLRGEAVGASSRAEEQDAATGSEQPDQDARTEDVSEQPDQDARTEDVSEQPDQDARTEDVSEQPEQAVKPRRYDWVEVVGRVFIVIVLLAFTVLLLVSALEGWSWGNTSAKQATAAAIALLSVQFGASALLVHRRWGWIFGDIFAAGFTFASLYSLIPETPTGNSYSVLFALLAIVPFAMVRGAEFLGKTESTPIWAFRTAWRVDRMRAEHARIDRLDADRRASWARRRKAVRKTLAVLRDRLLRRRKRAGSSKR